MALIIKASSSAVRSAGQARSTSSSFSPAPICCEAAWDPVESIRPTATCPRKHPHLLAGVTGFGPAAQGKAAGVISPYRSRSIITLLGGGPCARAGPGHGSRPGGRARCCAATPLLLGWALLLYSMVEIDNKGDSRYLSPATW